VFSFLEVILNSMTDPLIEAFEAVLADPKARASTKVNAAKELAKLRSREPEVGDPLGVMRSVVQEFAPEIEGMHDVPPDPMRDLDFQEM
jgi:hypothetical protein